MCVKYNSLSDLGVFVYVSSASILCLHLLLYTGFMFYHKDFRSKENQSSCNVNRGVCFGASGKLDHVFFTENSHRPASLTVLSWTSLENVKSSFCEYVCKMEADMCAQVFCVCVVCVVIWPTVRSLQCNGSAWQDGESWKGLCICIRVRLCCILSVHFWNSSCLRSVCFKDADSCVVRQWKEEELRHARLRQATNLCVCVYKVSSLWLQYI